jgi:hypothetical protein
MNYLAQVWRIFHKEIILLSIFSEWKEFTVGMLKFELL